MSPPGSTRKRALTPGQPHGPLGAGAKRPPGPDPGPSGCGTAPPHSPPLSPPAAPTITSAPRRGAAAGGPPRRQRSSSRPARPSRIMAPLSGLHRLWERAPRAGAARGRAARGRPSGDVQKGPAPLRKRGGARGAVSWCPGAPTLAPPRCRGDSAPGPEGSSRRRREGVPAAAAAVMPRRVFVVGVGMTKVRGCPRRRPAPSPAPPAR